MPHSRLFYEHFSIPIDHYPDSFDYHGFEEDFEDDYEQEPYLPEFEQMVWDDLAATAAAEQAAEQAKTKAKTHKGLFPSSHQSAAIPGQKAQGQPASSEAPAGPSEPCSLRTHAPTSPTIQAQSADQPDLSAIDLTESDAEEFENAFAEQAQSKAPEYSLDWTEADEQEFENAFAEVTQAKALQSSVASKRGHESTLEDDDVIEISPPSKRCRLEESIGSLRYSHPEQHGPKSHLGKRIRESTPDDVSPPQKKHRSTVATQVPAKPTSRLQASRTTGQETRQVSTSHPIEQQGHKPPVTESPAQSTTVATKAQKRRRDAIEDHTESISASHVKRQRTDNEVSKSRSIATASHDGLAPHPRGNLNEAFDSPVQHEQGQSVQSDDSVPEQASPIVSMTTDSGRKSSKLEEASASTAAATNPTPVSVNLGYRNRHPETAEDRMHIAHAIAYTYSDLIDRRPEFRKKERLHIEREAQTGLEFDTCQYSFGYQWNRLQSMYQEALETESRVAQPVNLKSRRKTKKQKQAERNREYLVEVDGPWMTGFNDWKEPGASKEPRNEVEANLNEQGSSEKPITL